MSCLREGRLDYVQLSIDLSAETIRLEASESGARAGGGVVTPVDLVERTPVDRPRYHVYVFRYTHEGDARESTGETQEEEAAVVCLVHIVIIGLFSLPVFIYTMPGNSASIKEKMLYSSCKNGLVDSLQQKGIQIDKKVGIRLYFLLQPNYKVKSLHGFYYFIGGSRHCEGDHGGVPEGRAPPCEEPAQAQVCQACTAQQRKPQNHKATSVLKRVQPQYIVYLAPNVGHRNALYQSSHFLLSKWLFMSPIQYDECISVLFMRSYCEDTFNYPVGHCVAEILIRLSN